MEEGRLTPVTPVDRKVTYHDPCFLGRHNKVYTPPREILDSVQGLSTQEMHRCKDRGFCCGAGGARMWMEEKIGKRINVERTEEALELDPDVISTACPFCITMLSDALTTQEAERRGRRARRGPRRQPDPAALDDAGRRRRPGRRVGSGRRHEGRPTRSARVPRRRSTAPERTCGSDGARPHPGARAVVVRGDGGSLPRNDPGAARRAGGGRSSGDPHRSPGPPPTPRAGAGDWLLIGVAIVLTGLNLRTAVTSVGPVLQEIQDGLGISSGLAGLVTTMPVLCFAAIGFAGPPLSARFRDSHVLSAARCWPWRPAWWSAPSPRPSGCSSLGTVLAMVGGALGNVLLPSLVKRYFPHRTGLLVGAYSTAMAVGRGRGGRRPRRRSPPRSGDDGWRWALGIWAVLRPAGGAARGSPSAPARAPPGGTHVAVRLRDLVHSRMALGADGLLRRPGPGGLRHHRLVGPVPAGRRPDRRGRRAAARPEPGGRHPAQRPRARRSPSGRALQRPLLPGLHGLLRRSAGSGSGPPREPRRGCG